MLYAYSRCLEFSGKKASRGAQDTEGVGATELQSGVADAPTDATVQVEGTLSFTPSKDTIKELLQKVRAWNFTAAVDVK
jgi:hypothetical protein